MSKLNRPGFAGGLFVKVSCEQLGWVPAIQSVNDAGTMVRFSGVGLSGDVASHHMI